MGLKMLKQLRKEMKLKFIEVNSARLIADMQVNGFFVNIHNNFEN